MNLQEAIDARDAIAAGLSTFPQEFLAALKRLGITGPCTGYPTSDAAFSLFTQYTHAALIFENKGRWFLLLAAPRFKRVHEIGYDPRDCRPKPCEAGGQCTCDDFDDDDYYECAYCACDCDACCYSYACATHNDNHTI